MGPGGCWLWTKSITQGERGGYAQFWADGHMVKAHRWAYETFVGPVPSGHELDHLCRTRHCVNPGHLQPVSHGTNVRRGDHQNRRKTHCPNGHPYSGRTKRDDRLCHGCEAARQRRRKEAVLNRTNP